MHDRESGFTLLEILVALVVLGFLVAGLAQGTRFGIAAWRRQAVTVDARAEMDAVDRILRLLVAEMAPGSATVAAGMAGNASGMACISRLPMAAHSGPADVRLLVDGDHRLILRWSPHRDGRPLGPPPHPTDTVLLDGVARLEMSYWPPPPGTSWLRAWGETSLPLLVRIRLVFPPGDPRHWPDIVAAPMRAPNDG